MRFVKFVFSRFFICFTVIAALIAAIIFLCFYIHSLLPAAAAIVLSYLISLIAALILLADDSPAEFKCVWLLVVALPLSGAVLYFLSRLRRTQRAPRTPPLPASSCSSYEYFADGATFLDRLISLVSTAKKQVLLEFYIISKGHIWGALCRELKIALARGVEVNIIYDGLGSALRAPKRDFKELARAGAKIKIFNRLSPFPFSRINFRDHRKIAVIDSDAVFLGGVNIADEYANLCSPHGYWKDGGALFFGNIANVYSRLFSATFNGENPASGAYMPQITEKHTLYPVADVPVDAGGFCEDLLASSLYSAKERVYIFTPYLCTGDKLYGALTFAARQGADVRIIVPEIPDKKLTYAITRSYCERLVCEGVKVYTYTPGFMHFKAAVCDNSVLLGSYNLDFRSMRLNYECGVLAENDLAEEIARDFNACLALSRPFTAKKRRAAGRLTLSLLRLFAPLV